MNTHKTYIASALFLLLSSILACTLSPASPTSPAAATDTAPVPTQPATATYTPEPTLSPTPTPPALRVTYVKDGSVWLWTEGIGPQQLTKSDEDTNPVISSDGLEIAFERAGDLWVVNSDGTSERQVASAGGIRPRDRKPEENSSGSPRSPRSRSSSPSGRRTSTSGSSTSSR